MSGLNPRYPGRRWELLYGSYEGVERFAVDELQRTIQRCLPYVLTVRPADGEPSPEMNTILAGTPGGNPWISQLIESGALAAPPAPQGFTMACIDSPRGREGKVLAVAGYDGDGVRNGIEALNARVLAPLIARAAPGGMREEFDGLRQFALSESPLIEDRGIWTWGYVVYDYRRFIDSMARLRMNMLTIWNDCPPENAHYVIEYAHSRGIRVILGCHWGWGMSDISLSSAADRRMVKASVVANYERDYQHLGADGIYFQTLTEHSDLEAGGRTVASLACEWVNDIAAGLYDIEPDLHIQFGLHATSIRDNYPYLARLDRRMVIVWEDAGNLPYPYYPDPFRKPAPPGEMWPPTPEETVEYSKKLATFRPGAPFALVPKGWTCLRWDTEFEHHGSFVLGERHPDFIRERLRERRQLWDEVNALWLKHYPLALKFYREMLSCAPPRMTVTGLIEDGLFEEEIQPSVALFAETLWDPSRPETEILERASSPWYSSEPR